MPTVSELKAQARTCQEQGDPIQALAIYRGLLLHLEQWGGLDDEVDLFRRVGDLRLQLRQPARAYAAYRQAAEHYARLGAAEEIKTLCVQMIDVVPAAGDSFVRFARRLLEHGHMGPSVDVLREYGSLAGSDWVSEGVSSLVGRSDDEARHLLEKLLDDIDRDSPGHALAAERASAQPWSEPEPTPVDAGGIEERVVTSEAAPPEAPADDPGANQADAEYEHTAGMGGTSTGSVFAIEETDAVEQAEAAASNPDPSQADKPKRISVPKDAIVTAPRVWGHTASSPATAKEFPWRNVGIAAGIAGAVGLVIVGIGSIGGDDGGVVPQPPVMAAAMDTSPGSIDAQSDNIATEREPEATFTPPVPPTPDPAPVQPEPAAVDTSPQLTSDTTALDSALDTLLGDAADSVVFIAQPIVVDSLTILSVAEIEFRGQSGFRVVHLLDSGAEFVVESFPVDSNAASTYPLGTVIVNIIPPDTAVSIVRFDERYLVFASGVAPEDSVRALVAQLRVREPSN